MCECLTIRSSFFGKVAEPLNNCIAYGSSSYAQIKNLDCFRMSGGFYRLKMSIFGSSFAKEVDHVKRPKIEQHPNICYYGRVAISCGKCDDIPVMYCYASPRGF